MLTKVKNVLDITADTVVDLLSAKHKKGSVQLLGYHERGDGGGGVFYWDANKPKTEHNGGTVIDPDAVLAGFYYTSPNAGDGCWIREKAGDELCASWFGLTGSNATILDMGIDSSLQYWAEPFDNATYSPLLDPTTALTTPMLEATDTMDTLALQAAINCSEGKSLLIDKNDVHLSKAVVVMYGRKKDLKGLGKLKTVLQNDASDNPAYSDTRFSTARVPSAHNSQNALLLLATTDDGNPMTISGLGFKGRVGYIETNNTDFKLISMCGANGIYITDCWLTSASNGIYMVGEGGRSGSDCHFNHLVAEYCFKYTIYGEQGTFFISDSNLWQSQTVFDTTAVRSDSNQPCGISNTLFQGFSGITVNMGNNAKINSCTFNCAKRASISVADGCIITSNLVTNNSPVDSIIVVESDNTIVGNKISSSGTQPLIDLIGVAAGSNEGCVLSSNLLQKTTATPPDSNANVAIRDSIPGTAFSGASANTVVTNNNFKGNAARVVGLKNKSNLIDDNVFDTLSNICVVGKPLEKEGRFDVAAGSFVDLVKVSYVAYTSFSGKVSLGGILQGVGQIGHLTEQICLFGGSGAAGVTDITSEGVGVSTTALTVGFVQDGTDYILRASNSETNDMDLTYSYSIKGVDKDSIEVLV